MSDATPEPASRWYVIPFLSLMFAAGLGLVYLVRDSAPPAAHQKSAASPEAEVTDALSGNLSRLEQDLTATAGRIERLEGQAAELLGARDQLASSQGELASEVERLGQGLRRLSETLASSAAPPSAPTVASTAEPGSAPAADARTRPADDPAPERIAAIEAGLKALGERLAALEQGSSELGESQSQLILSQAETLAAERESLLAEMQRMLDSFRAEQQAAPESARKASTTAGASPALADLARDFAPLGARFTADGLQLTLAESDLSFASGTAILPRGAVPSLDALVEVLGAHSQLRVRLRGHTDSLGESEANQRLSEARAEAVRQELIARGIGAERIQAEGAGEVEPVADNATAAGRARNRRVEIYLTDAQD